MDLKKMSELSNSSHYFFFNGNFSHYCTLQLYLQEWQWVWVNGCLIRGGNGIGFVGHGGDMNIRF